MKSKLYHILCILIVFSFVSCATTRRTTQKDKQQELTEQTKQDLTVVDKHDSTTAATDTTKTYTQKLTITDVTVTETITDTTGSKTEKVTNFKQTELYLSEEDKFLFENGYLLDSTEVKQNYLQEKQQKQHEQNREKQKNSNNSSNFWCWFWLIVLLLLCALVVYVRVKIRR